MIEAPHDFVLHSPNGTAPVLEGVDVEAVLDGMLLQTTLRQTYRNAADRTLEVVYTFPLAPGAVVLGFAATLNGVRQEGRIVARPEAENRYEAALEQGDAPVMLEVGAQGLHTANIGNLKPGDELVVELRCAQLQALEGQRLRVAIPCTVAPRYGRPAQAGLQPQQVPQSSLTVVYPLSMSLQVRGTASEAAWHCATHPARARLEGGALRLTLEPGARLDRDVVFSAELSGASWPSLAVAAHDAWAADAPHVVLTALQAAPLAAAPAAVAVKALVDCSGSMAGDSIASARRALQGLLAALGPADALSLTRFGGNVEPVLPLTRCDEAGHEALRMAIHATEACLGGTEMEAALMQVFGQPVPERWAAEAEPAANRRADVLLVTDGEIWASDSLMAAARASGHRVFTVGVGASPAASLLRALAEDTGGACEFATPGEALEAAAARMLARIRQASARSLRVTWGAEPRWQLALPAGVFAGDTVFAMAGFAQAPSGPIRLLARDATGAEHELARCESAAPMPAETDALARVAAQRRLASEPPHAQARLALAYQLMSEHTHCILVHERAEGARAQGPASFVKVPSMLAAGWGGTGSVLAAVSKRRSWPNRAFHPVDADVVYRTVRMDPCLLPLDDAHPVGDGAAVGMPAFGGQPITLRWFSQWIGHALAAGRAPEWLPQTLVLWKLHDELAALIAELQGRGLSESAALVLVAHWVYTQCQPGDEPQRAVAQALAAQVLPDEAGALALVAQRLGACSLDGWPETRAQRLARVAGAA